MARITPRTSWAAGNIPVPSDLNRIESNSQQAFDEMDSEIAARIADVNAEEARALAAESVLQGSITAEAGARSAADGVLQGNIDAEAGARAGADAAHAALTGSSAHGAVSAATANQIVVRDAAGRAKIAAPSAADDIAQLQTVSNEASRAIGVENGLQGQITGIVTLDAIGSYAFLYYTVAANLDPGAVVAGSSLRWADSILPSSTAPSGSWMCCGRVTNFSGSRGSTLFRRVS